MKKILLFCCEIVSGFISVWWFIIAIAMALNPDHNQDSNFLIPVGYMFLGMLLVWVIYGNYFLYKKHCNQNVFVVYQIIPFSIGVIIAVFQTI